MLAVGLVPIGFAGVGDLLEVGSVEGPTPLVIGVLVHVVIHGSFTPMSNEFRTYLFNYNHAGASWGLEIKAESPEDAKRRLTRLAFASYQGEVIAKVPAFAGTPARAVVALRNVGRRLIEFFTR